MLNLIQIVFLLTTATKVPRVKLEWLPRRRRVPWRRAAIAPLAWNWRKIRAPQTATTRPIRAIFHMWRSPGTHPGRKLPSDLLLAPGWPTSSRTFLDGAHLKLQRAHFYKAILGHCVQWFSAFNMDKWGRP